MSSTLQQRSTRNAPASRSVAADGFVITLRSDSFDLTPVHSSDSAILITELSSLNSLSNIWSVGLSRSPSITYDAQQQPSLTSALPHSSAKWALLSSVNEWQDVLAYGSVIAKLLHHWHALGVVHRSLSPSSVLVDLAQSKNPDENSVVLLLWGGSAIYHWNKEAYICGSPCSHPSASFAPPERLSFSLEMFAPLGPAEDWFSLGRMLASRSPLATPARSAFQPVSSFEAPVFDAALSVLVSGSSFAGPSPVMSALLEPDPVLRHLHGHSVSEQLKVLQSEPPPSSEAVVSLYRPTGIAWPLPGLQLHHDGKSPLSQVLFFKTHLRIRVSCDFDSSSFLTLGCTIVQSLFVLWNHRAQVGRMRSSQSVLDLQSPSFFLVPERHSELNLPQTIMLALDNCEAISETAPNSLPQIDCDAVVAKLGDLFRQHSGVVTVLVPIFESEIGELVEINAMILKNNICAVFVAIVDEGISPSLCGQLCTGAKTQVIDLTTPLASCSYLNDAVSQTLNLPDPLLGDVVKIFANKVGAAFGAVVSDFLLWSDQLMRQDVVRFVPQSGMVHTNRSSLISAPVSFVVASSVSSRILQHDASGPSATLRLCAAVSATCGDTCSYELPVELALAAADVSRSTLDEAVAMGLCVVTRSETFDSEFISLTHEHFRTFEGSQVEVHIRFVQLLYSQIDQAMQSSSHVSLLTGPLRPGLVNHAVSLVPVFARMDDDVKLLLKRDIFALSEHMFALSSVGSTGSDTRRDSEDNASSQADPSFLSKRLPSHLNLARLLLLGVQLSNSSLEYNKARTFASAGVSLLSSLDKSITKEYMVSLLHFQMHCETLMSFVNQNVTQGTDSEKMLLQQYSEGGSSRWCSGTIFSALFELSQSVNFMQRCYYHDSFNYGCKAFSTIMSKKELVSTLSLQDLLPMLSNCISQPFWTEEIDGTTLSQSQTDFVFLFDAFERLVLPSLSCGVEAVLKLVSIHTNFCLKDSEAKAPLSLTIVPIMTMLIATHSSPSAVPLSTSVLLEFMAEHLRDTVPGLQFLQSCLWTAFSIVPFSSAKSIEAFVKSYSAKLRPVENLSEMTAQSFEFPYNGSSLLAASHLLGCIASDLSDANEGELCCTAQFLSAALVFISGCDISRLCVALAATCASQSLSTFGERLLGSLISVVQSPLQAQVNCRKDAELLPEMFYFVIISIEVLWNVILEDWDATLSASKRASVLKTGPMLPFFQLNLNLCSCLARLQKLLVVTIEDVKMSLLAEIVADFDDMFSCIDRNKISSQVQMARSIKDPAAKTNRLMSCLLQESSSFFELPGGGLLQIVCALFCEFLQGTVTEISDCYENAYDLCLRDGLMVHSALASHLGHSFLNRTSLSRHRTASSDFCFSDDETSHLKSSEGETARLKLDMRAVRQLERAHALFSVMRFDTPALTSQQLQPSLASAIYPDCPLSNSASHNIFPWFSGFITHDRLLRMQGSFGFQTQGPIQYLKASNAPSSSNYSSLMELANRIQSDLHRIVAPGPLRSPVNSLLHAAQIIGRTIGAQRAIVISKTSTSVSLSANIEALAEVSFLPLSGPHGENIVALCSQSVVNNLPEWLLKYGFNNRGVHIFQNVSTSFGLSIPSEQDDGDAILPVKNVAKFSFVGKKFSPKSRSQSQSMRRSSSIMSSKSEQKSMQADSGLSSVAMLSWGNGASGESEPLASYLLYFEHRRILGMFGPEFYLNTIRCSPDQVHPSAHPLAFLLGKCLLPLKSLSGPGQQRVERVQRLTFSQKDVDEEMPGNQIADRLPIVGILWKRGSMIKNWKERHFQLFNMSFKYFTKDDKINALKSIEISHDMTIIELSAGDRKEISAPYEHCFCLMNDKLQLYLCADQIGRMKKWMKILSSTIEHARKVMHQSHESYAFNACVAPPPLNSMSIIKRLGAGGFGEVFLASWNGLHVAVKKMTKELNSTTVFRFRREADMMSIMRHPNILTYMACSLDPPDLMIVMEYMSYGSLFNVLQNLFYSKMQDMSLNIPFKRVLSMATDCACAMVYLHSASPPILHRDLKAENLLVDANWTVKVADFGLARNMGNENVGRRSVVAVPASTLSSQSTQMTSNVGSIRYCAPELLTVDNLALYNEQADVYSFGIILWELANRPLRPYHHVPATFPAIQKAILSGDRPRMPDHIDMEYTELYLACVQEKPSKRPSFDTVCRKLQSISKRLQGLKDE